MDRIRSRKSTVLVGLIAIGLSALVAFATGGWLLVGYDVSGNTVTTQVHNSGSRTITGTISVEIVKDGQTYDGTSAQVAISPNATISIPIIVGTITDDITPFSAISFAVRTD